MNIRITLECHQPYPTSYPFLLLTFLTQRAYRVGRITTVWKSKGSDPKNIDGRTGRTRRTKEQVYSEMRVQVGQYPLIVIRRGGWEEGVVFLRTGENGLIVLVVPSRSDPSRSED